MSAREKILTYGEDNRENLSALLDAYAHELAEQIREAASNWGGVPDMDAHDAADLIDPAAIGRDAEGNPA